MADRPAVQRRLAAILAADVFGYSRLMGADEEGTLAQLKAHRRQLAKRTPTTRRSVWWSVFPWSIRPPASCSSMALEKPTSLTENCHERELVSSDGVDACPEGQENAGPVDLASDL
jgi:hypothetical protein